MNIYEISKLEKGLVMDLAISHLAQIIYDNLGHKTVEDKDRWEFDRNIAEKHMKVDSMVLWNWTTSFISLAAYCEHNNITDEIIRRGLNNVEKEGIISGTLARELPDDTYHKSKRNTTRKQKAGLFGLIGGEQVWVGYGMPMKDYRLYSEGYFKRG